MKFVNEWSGVIAFFNVSEYWIIIISRFNLFARIFLPLILENYASLNRGTMNIRLIRLVQVDKINFVSKRILFSFKRNLVDFFRSIYGLPS